MPHPAEAALSGHIFTSLSQIITGVSTSPVDPLAVVALGLVVLLSTPVLGVALAAGTFAARRDRTYLLISGLVLVILLLSLLLGGRPE
jgi:uncharacterized membrane protein